MKTLEKILKASSDINRLRIINMLRNGALCVCEITYVLGLAPSTASKHLTILRDAGFIKDEKKGKWVYYKLNDENKIVINEILRLILDNTSKDKLASDDIDKINRMNIDNICKNLA